MRGPPLTRRPRAFTGPRPHLPRHPPRSGQVPLPPLPRVGGPWFSRPRTATHPRRGTHTPSGWAKPGRGSVPGTQARAGRMGGSGRPRAGTWEKADAQGPEPGTPRGRRAGARGRPRGDPEGGRGRRRGAGAESGSGWGGLGERGGSGPAGGWGRGPWALTGTLGADAGFRGAEGDPGCGRGFSGRGRGSRVPTGGGRPADLPPCPGPTAAPPGRTGCRRRGARAPCAGRWASAPTSWRRSGRPPRRT